jgi:hypothetical protein
MGRGYSGNHPRFSKRGDERYDAKEAYNKDLTASARLHYLENDRHDHDSPAHMSVNQRINDSLGLGQNNDKTPSPMNSHCSPMHAHNRSHKLRQRAVKISERSGAERGDEYDYENPRVQRLLSKANKADEKSGEMRANMTRHIVKKPKVKNAFEEGLNALSSNKFVNDERSGEIRNEMINEMIDERPDSPMNEISKRGERILNQADKARDAYSEGNIKKGDRHAGRARRIKKRDDKGHARANQSPMNACAKSEGGSGCVKQMGGSWRVISNKTDKPWPAKYASKAKADAALRGYHAG